MPEHDHDAPTPQDRPDEHARAITARIARGDPEAFAELYEYVFDRALLDARGLTGRDEAFCLDVVQDAMLRAARRMPRLDTWAAVGAWMRRAIASSAIDLLRAEASRRKRERSTGHEREDGPRPTEAPEAEMIDAMQELSDREWQAVRMHVGHGLSLAAVGRAMRISRNAAHGLVRRGVRRLGAGADTDSNPSEGKT
ncbi:MAG: sigma-70 family RNA polymerase sigma factor [Planctomycetota bacterium]